MHLPAQPPIRIGTLEIRYLIDGTETHSASGMFELLVPPGANVPPPHSHSLNEEIVYCLEGTLRTVVGGEVRDLAPGEGRYTPLGVVHGFSNPFDKPARALFVLSPDIGAQYFRDVAQVVTAPGGPDPARLAEVMRCYGLVLAPKPAAA